MSLTAALEHGLNRNWYGYLSAFSVADPIFVQGDKEDRASAIKLVFPEFPTQAAEHDPVPRHTGEILGVSQPVWVTAHTATGTGDPVMRG